MFSYNCNNFAEEKDLVVSEGKSIVSRIQGELNVEVLKSAVKEPQCILVLTVSAWRFTL